jgi:hypothetical protein
MRETLRIETMRAPSPVCFLFSIEGLEREATLTYDVPAKSRLIPEAVASGVRSAAVMSGDVLLHLLADRTTRFTGDGDKSTSTTEAFDRDAFASILREFVESIHENWTTLAEENVVHLLARHDAYAITLSATELAAAEAIDSALRGAPGYIGAFCVDRGNPLHARVAIGLPTTAYLLDAEVVFDPWSTDDPFDPPSLVGSDGWWAAGGLAARYMRDVERDDLPQVQPRPLSERGAQSASLLQRVMRRPHLEDVGKQLVDDQLGPGKWRYTIDVASLPRAADAVVPRAKLERYALNPAHDKGGSGKARVFEAALGITAADWEFLARQIKAGLQDARSVQRVRSEQYGVQYHVVVDVIGKNGNVRPVLTAWIVRPGEPPSLTSAYVTTKPTDVSAVARRMVDPSLRGNERWAELWRLAHDAGCQAVESCVPVPVYVGRRWYAREGGASVTLADSDAFVDWLRVNIRGARLSEEGRIVAPARGFDAAAAYAEAVAAVLRLNGVDAQPDAYLD